MNQRQIECFLEAARQLNFTRAAETLMLPQPAVSRYISALEAELETELFIRESNRKITLSDAGKAYYNLFQRFAMEMAHTRQQVSENKVALRLGYNVGWDLAPFLPEVTEQCRQAAPGYRLSFECLGFRDLIRALQEKRLDAVISMENYLSREPDLELERVTSIRRSVVYSRRLEGADKIRSLSDFYPYDFYIVDDPRVRELCRDTEELFYSYHFVPRFVTVPNLETMFACINNGLGVALMDQWWQYLHSPDIRAWPLDDWAAIALAWRRHGDTPAVELFRDRLTAWFHTGMEDEQR